jgi:hypothetical protein
MANIRQTRTVRPLNRPCVFALRVHPCPTQDATESHVEYTLEVKSPKGVTYIRSLRYSKLREVHKVGGCVACMYCMLACCALCSDLCAVGTTPCVFYMRHASFRELLGCAQCCAKQDTFCALHRHCTREGSCGVWWAAVSKKERHMHLACDTPHLAC